MAYIGTEPTQSTFTSVEYTATAAQTTFPTSGVLPETALNSASAMVKVNGLVSHTSSYTIGTTLIFSAGLDVGDKVEVIWLGLAGSLSLPADNTVTNAKIARAGTSGQVLTSSGTGADATWAKVSTGHASTWNLFDSFTGDATPIGESDGSGGYIGAPTEVANGSRGYARVGDPMTQTLGVFTFPETGVYTIGFGTNNSCNGTATISDTAFISVSTDGGSTWYDASAAYFSCPTTSSTRTGSFQQIQLNVDNVSNVKVRFIIDVDVSVGTSGLGGSPNLRRDTYFTFVKLAESP